MFQNWLPLLRINIVIVRGVGTPVALARRVLHVADRLIDIL